MASAFRMHRLLVNCSPHGKSRSLQDVFARGLQHEHQHGSYYSTTSPSSQSFSRMLDMGGAPSGSTASKSNVGVRNTSKNSKVQGVAFDFELLTLSTLEEQEKAVAKSKVKTTTGGATLKTSATIKPDVNRVEEIATLLRTTSNVSTGSQSSEAHENDLAALLAGTEESQNVAKAAELQETSKVNSNTTKDDLMSNKGNIPASLTDIRSKYANKLRKAGVDGGVAGVDLANYQRQEATKKGDAEGHLTARKMALSQPTATDGGAGHSGTRWMALTGTGKLLSTLTYRSMKIALLPRTASMASISKTNTDRTSKERMVDFTRQLKDVRFDVLVDLPPNGSSGAADDNALAVNAMVQSALKQLELDTNVILFVSDQDAYLRAAKDLGMLTCRIRPRNARRGNVSSHYTVESILEVENVVNDINGISFNVVLNM